MATALAEPQAAAPDLSDVFGPAPARLWVYDLDICDDCGGVAERGRCLACEPVVPVKRRSSAQMRKELRRWGDRIDPIGEQRRRKAVADRIAESKRRWKGRREEVRLRPSEVVVRIGDEDTESLADDVAVLRVPADATASAKHVARAAALIATVRLDSGASLDFALGKLALGRDLVRRFLAEVYGIRLARNTVKAALDELSQLGVLPRVGQLGSWVDREAEGNWPKRQGAYLYRLNLVMRKVGQIALTAVGKVLGKRPRQGTATVRSTGHGARVDGALAAAIKYAFPGNRNHTGHWLTCRCTDSRLTEDETIEVMAIYSAAVTENRNTYSAGEAAATVRSRYRRLARAV